ncbi:type I restriction-modification system DNA methylase subunit [Paenibacillus sp. 1182]|uniref:SAM-dependent DNA methyltransferase n=1 Tax=Paenibacillus sp. 1182 TaxID=2806565 RepID=UPI001AE31434|nr:SAM-dependent DNA methyltransferase [Paenibacillus sp. 1182]MBP1308683.1 type I restriction-modification system DNA methylase subunit [Paenibacillus sp. 1182]
MNINKLLGIHDSNQAPAQIMEILYDRKKREEVFVKFLEAFNFNLSYDWFHDYFQEEHADRKWLKQDFTPMCVAELLAKITGGDKRTTYEGGTGTGGIMIRKWQEERARSSIFKYKPSDYLYVCEELSDKAIPFLLFNTLIRGMNAIIIHGDVLSQNCYGVFFVQNDKDDYMEFSSLNVMPYSQEVADFFDVNFVEECYPKWIESKMFPSHLGVYKTRRAV